MSKTDLVEQSDDTKPQSQSIQPSFTENSSLQITLHKLNGKNFLHWSQSVSLFLCGKGRLSFLTGESTAPSPDDPSFRQWDAENSMVLTWLINSMEIDIGKTYMFYPTAASLWTAIQETYSDLDNASQVFEIKSKLRDQRQGSLQVTEYYNILCTLWQELDLYYSNDWKCTADATIHAKRLEKEKVFDFLYGLDTQLDDVRGRVLSRSPFPSMREAFVEVWREETRRKVMLGGSRESETDSTALAAPAYSNRSYNDNSSGDSRPKSNRPWCEHCKKPGHVKDTCWKLHVIQIIAKESRRSLGDMLLTHLRRVHYHFRRVYYHSLPNRLTSYRSFSIKPLGPPMPLKHA